MMRSRKLILLTLISTVILLFCAVPVLASQATTIEKKYDHSKNGYISTKLYGRDSAGNKVWTYKCKTVRPTELDSVSYVIKGKYAYVIDDNRFVRIRLRDGKIINKKKLPESIWSAAMLVDKNGYLYAVGYYGKNVYKINKKGKVIWKSELPQNYDWPYKMKLSGKKLRIKFFAEWSPRYYYINTKSGKKY